MALRDLIHGVGRVLTRLLLYPRWRHRTPMVWTYLQLYLVGKRLTERSELSILRRLIRPGMVIVDIGANAGFYTLQMAAAVGPSGRILAFEPDPFNFKLLADRVRKARTNNIDILQVALGEKAGRALLYCSAYNRADNRLSASHAEEHVERCEVEVRTLDQVLASHGRPVIDALKIDVQGNEPQVLLGAQETLRSGLRWIWIEFSPDHLRGAGCEPEEFLSRLSGLEMDVFEVTDDGTLAPVTDHQGLVRRLGSSYRDLVLKSKTARSA